MNNTPETVALNSILLPHTEVIIHTESEIEWELALKRQYSIELEAHEEWATRWTWWDKI